MIPGDPDNIKYSCAFATRRSRHRQRRGPSWVDPRSAEILNASVYIYRRDETAEQLAVRQTAQADERVRAVTIPEVIGDGLRYVVASPRDRPLPRLHAQRMSASAVIPVDSLRSPSFTQKYGTTTSIMDYALFNYVARPRWERGVSPAAFRPLRLLCREMALHARARRCDGCRRICCHFREMDNRGRRRFRSTVSASGTFTASSPRSSDCERGSVRQLNCCLPKR